MSGETVITSSQMESGEGPVSGKSTPVSVTSNGSNNGHVSPSLNFSISRLLGGGGVGASSAHEISHSRRGRDHYHSNHHRNSYDSNQSRHGGDEQDRDTDVENDQCNNNNKDKDISVAGDHSSDSEGRNSDSEPEESEHGKLNGRDLSVERERDCSGNGGGSFPPNHHHHHPTGATTDGLNPFPVFGYTSIFLPNFPCPLTSPPNHVIRVPAHRPMSNFQIFGQSNLSHHNPLDLNAAPLFSNFDPRSSLLLKDRLNGK